MEPTVENARPPEPPDVPRQVQLYPHQWVLLPLLFLIPVLALLGVFGHTEARAGTRAGQSGGLELRVRYPSRTRHMIPCSVEIEVTNATLRAAEGVVVALDREYVEAFSEASLTPGPGAITEGEYRVPLGDLAPGETRAVTLEGRVLAGGLRKGSVTASARAGTAGGDSRASLSTFVFP